MTQVFGLLVVEIIALFLIMLVKPFEGARLNALMVYLLGFSKVSTVALSAAFDSRFRLERITTTAIGIVVIVIQGILTIILLIAIVVGVISSYMSLTRNREHFKPESWQPLRKKYFAHLEKVAPDVPPPPPPVPEEPKAPYFSVSAVRRCPKIEDEDEDFKSDPNDLIGSRTSILTPRNRTRTNSMMSQTSQIHSTLPFGARSHRASWSTRDFMDFQAEGASNRNSGTISTRNGLREMTSEASLRDIANRTPRPVTPGIRNSGTPPPRAGTPGTRNTGTPPPRAGTPRAQTPRSSMGPLDVRKSRLSKERESAVDLVVYEDGRE